MPEATHKLCTSQDLCKQLRLRGRAGEAVNTVDLHRTAALDPLAAGLRTCLALVPQRANTRAQLQVDLPPEDQPTPSATKFVTTKTA